MLKILVAAPATRNLAFKIPASKAETAKTYGNVLIRDQVLSRTVPPEPPPALLVGVLSPLAETRPSTRQRPEQFTINEPPPAPPVELVPPPPLPVELGLEDIP